MREKVLSFPRSLRWLLLGSIIFAAGWSANQWLWQPLPGANSAEVQFARDMAAHHEQAVSMAAVLYNRSADQELRIVALDIILTQQAQIGQMQGWLAVWDQPVAGLRTPMSGMASHTMDGQLMPTMGMATQAEVNALTTLPLAEAERSFLRLMIRHHEGGVQMAQTVVTQTDRAEIVRLANAIVVSQQSEIRTLQDMLADRQ